MINYLVAIGVSLAVALLTVIITALIFRRGWDNRSNENRFMISTVLVCWLASVGITGLIVMVASIIAR